MHADGALLLRGHVSEWANIQLRADVELSSSSIQHRHYKLALFLMLLAVLILTLLVAIPNAQAPIALLQSITRLSARRTHLLARFGPIFRVVCFGVVLLSFRRFAERHRTELLSRCHRRTFVFS